jgi:hypothetical protein
VAIKTLERQMYGRANFDLPRTRPAHYVTAGQSRSQDLRQI